MKNNIFLLLFLLFSTTSCISFYNLQGNGSSLNGTIAQKANNNVEDYKRGIACTTNILFLVAAGDSSVEKAKKNGNITEVAYSYTTYQHFMLYIPLFQKGCTVVVGK